MEKNVLPILGVILGGLITIACSRYYYIKATKALLRETELLKKYNNMILSLLEAVNIEKLGIRFERNEKGEIMGWKPIQITVNAVLPAVTVSCEGAVGAPFENQET